MSDKKTDKPVIVTTEYKLPSGAVVHARKPNNGDRRTLLDAPEVNQRYLMEILSAACMVKLEFPKGHEKWPGGSIIDFTGEVKDAWPRLDELDLEDSISYVEAFGANNWPSEEIIKKVVESSKLKK